MIMEGKNQGPNIREYFYTISRKNNEKNSATYFNYCEGFEKFSSTLIENNSTNPITAIKISIMSTVKICFESIIHPIHLHRSKIVKKIAYPYSPASKGFKNNCDNLLFLFISLSPNLNTK